MDKYGLSSYFGASTGNAPSTSDWAKSLLEQEKDFYLDDTGSFSDALAKDTRAMTTASLISNDLPGASTTSGDWWGETRKLLGDKDFMSGALGLGQLGLGLANYFQMQPMYEQQLKSMKLQNRLAKEADQRQKATRTGLASAIANAYSNKG